jgi:NADH:ubiquinone oxidoreductase subunit 4 (subunit M)
VEAPTLGSILLAAILLKLGVFGILKFLVIVSGKIFINFLFLFRFLGSIISCFLCFFQTDVKALIAYSRVVHINFLLIGLISKYFLININVILIIIFHAFIRRIIFFKAGFIFSNFKTRKIYFSNFSSNPNKIIIIVLILIFILNFNPPPSLGVLPEIYYFISFFNKNYFYFLFLFIFGILSSFFCIYLIIVFINGKITYLKNMRRNFNFNYFNILTSIFIFNFILIILIF